MNIFVFDLNPTTAARQHCDKHVIKLIVEATQMLSTTHQVNGTAPDGAYKAAYQNHPCTLWVGRSKTNYRWLHSYAMELCQIYTQRYSRIHKSQTVLSLIPNPPHCLPEGPLTPFAQAMPEQYRNEDPVLAYQQYFCAEKRHLAQWKDGAPEWWNE